MTFAATVKALYLCGVNAAWLELVPVLAHNQVDAVSIPAAATFVDLIGFGRWLLPVAGGLFFYLEKRVFRRFKAFSLRIYIIYQLVKENGLNRILGKNNFFGILTIKFFLCEKSIS